MENGLAVASGVARLAFQGLAENEIGRVRISILPDVRTAWVARRARLPRRGASHTADRWCVKREILAKGLVPLHSGYDSLILGSRAEAGIG